MSLSGRPGNAGSRLHNYLYDALGLDYIYKSFSTRDLPAAVAGIRALDIRGSAISMPFKEAVIPLIDALEPSALAIDSVNTIVNDDGHLTGYNTDYTACRQLIEASPADPAKPFLLRGSGGMAKAVVAALRDAGFTQGTIVARNPRPGRRWQSAMALLGQRNCPRKARPCSSTSRRSAWKAPMPRPWLSRRP
jgi:shikimate dehydrogenase